MMERDNYFGRILTGRIASGTVRVGDKVHGLRLNGSNGEVVEVGKVKNLIKTIVMPGSNIQALPSLSSIHVFFNILLFCLQCIFSEIWLRFSFVTLDKINHFYNRNN